MKKNIIRGILIVLLLGTFYIIFGFSSQDGEKSGSVSKTITEVLVTKIPSIQEKEELEKQKIILRIEKVIRKIAHFSIYTVVGILLMALMSTYELKLRTKVAISLLIGYLYATSDEIHQSFVPERSPQMTDVAIDTMGVLLGILLVILVIKVVKKYNTKIDIK